MDPIEEQFLSVFDRLDVFIWDQRNQISLETLRALDAENKAYARGLKDEYMLQMYLRFERETHTKIKK